MAEYHKWLVKSGGHFIGSKSYKAGDKFITEANIAGFNTDKQKPKYEDLGVVTEAEYLKWMAQQGFNTGDGSTKVPPSKAEVEEAQAKDSLEALTVAELKDLAADEEIDLGSKHLKADIIQAIREARDVAIE